MSRVYHARAADGRNYVSGIVVPFDETIEIDGRTETFERGAFTDWIADGELDQVPLRWLHTSGELLPIGVAVLATEREEGLFVEFRMATTEMADEVFRLVEDETLSYFSVEFLNRSPNRPIPNGDKSAAQGRVTRADLMGSAIVEYPAYSRAKVLSTRDKPPSSNPQSEEPMSGVTQTQERALRESDEDRMGDHADRMEDEKRAADDENRMPEYVRGLIRQVNDLEERLARMEGTAKDENRSLTAAEEAVVSDIREQISERQEQMEVYARDEARKQRTQQLNRALATVYEPGSPTVTAGGGSLRGDGKEIEHRGRVTNVKIAKVYTPDDAAKGVSFYRDLYRYCNMHDATVRTSQGFDQSIERIVRHQEQAIDEMPQQRAVLTSNLAGIVPPQYLLELTAPGLYDGRQTANLMNRYPLPELGEEFNIPRFTTKAQAGTQAAQNTKVQEASPAATNGKFNLSTIAAFGEISRQSIDRGFMVDSLISNEMLMAYNQQLNTELLYGGNNGTDHLTSQRALLLANGLGTKIEYTEASPTLVKLWQKLGLQLGALSEARKMRANAIIMSPTLWAKFTTAVDSDNRPLFQQLIQTATNVMGIGDPQMASDGAITSVGTMHAVPVFTDDHITDTFKADNSAQTGGAESRIVLARREDMLLMESGQGPMTASYDATAATNLMTTLVVYGYIASTVGRYPEGVQIIGGTGSNPSS